MSIESEINRIESAKSKISEKMQSFGLSESTDKIDALADDVNSIPNRGAINATLMTDYDGYTIPDGYHNGLGTVKGSSYNPTMIGEIVLAQDDAPVNKPHNQIWIDTSPTQEYVVPTIDEFNALVARVTVLERDVDDLTARIIELERIVSS